MFCSVFIPLSLPHCFAPSFTKFLSFPWQTTGQMIQKAKLFPVKPTFFPPPCTSMKVTTSALFSILIVISFDRTCSLSLKAQVTNTILFSSSPSLATNSIACIRVSSSLKTSRADLCGCIVWRVISRLQEGSKANMPPYKRPETEVEPRVKALPHFPSCGEITACCAPALFPSAVFCSPPVCPGELNRSFLSIPSSAPVLALEHLLRSDWLHLLL